ncbi:MAG: polysulfide reductase NrfD, partial [Chromatiales bacterium]
ARQAYDAAILAPMFIVMSFSFGLAIYLLVLMFAFNMDKRPLGASVVRRLKNLLGVFVAGVMFFTLIYHLTNLYGTENHAVEAFILRDGGVYTLLFWAGEVMIGGLIPLAILFHPVLGKSLGWIAGACAAVILGGFAKVYVIVIGGQAFPMTLFADKEILESGFYDGVVATYAPSLPEVLLGIGGVAVALAGALVAIRVLRFLPQSLADEDVDPHASASAA